MKSPCTLLTLLLLSASASRAQAGHGFGGSVAIEEDVIFVAKALTYDSSGTVYVFTRNADTQAWIEHQRLQASDATGSEDHFGRALAASGSLLFVGAIGSDEQRGAVYVFARRDGVWVESAKLTASDAAPKLHFGNNLAVHGNRLLVSAIGPSPRYGAVYVYELDDRTGNWSERAVWRGREAGTYDRTPSLYWSTTTVPVAGFGAALALTDHQAIVAAPYFGGGVLVYTHDSETDRWSISDTLTILGQEPRHMFGHAMALEENRLFVSAPRHDNDQGTVFIFEKRNTPDRWVQPSRLTGVHQTRGLRMLGTKLALHGSDLWASAPQHWHQDGLGSLYHFRRDADTGQWRSVTELHPGDFLAHTAAIQLACNALAMQEHIMVCGDPDAHRGRGTAYVFEYQENGWTETAQLIDAAKGIPSIVGAEVTCADGKAARFDCSEVDLLSFLSVADLGGGHGMGVNDLWGWTDPETGREWALVGRMDGTAFVDITDPLNPVLTGDLPQTHGSPASTWRDIKVYDHHAFIVADGAWNHGMQVFDLRALRAVKEPPVRFAAVAHYDGIATAHNIVINESTGFAYAVGSTSLGYSCGGGLHMIDIRNPRAPVFAGCFSDTGTGRAGTGSSHDAQCVSYHGPDAEHRGKEVCFSANETALSIADVTDKDHPVKLSSASYPNYGYAHQGWLTEDHRHFYMNDEMDEGRESVEGTRTLIWDVADLDDPLLAMEHVSENTATDHNLYIVGDLMYQSNYRSGLRILDITDRTRPVEVGYFVTAPDGADAPGFRGSWSNYPFFKSGSIIVTSIDEGLFILKKRSMDI